MHQKSLETVVSQNVIHGIRVTTKSFSRSSYFSCSREPHAVVPTSDQAEVHNRELR